jgi:Xaa-Pro aminopeptidase
MNRVEEIAAKLGRLVDVLEASGADALRLRGSEWFAWATGGGSNVVLLASETGVAEVFVTRDVAWILTDEIEAARLAAEEVVGPFVIKANPWAEPAHREDLVRSAAAGRVLSDRPVEGEEPLPPEVSILRRILLDGPEIHRYRDVGRRAAQAMSEAMRGARPDWSERTLAAAGAAALWQRGLEPALVLTAGARRGDLYRHVTVKNDPLGAWGMMVFCARGNGLYANLTRFISFGPLDAAHRERHARLLTVEARIWAATKAGARLDELYEVLRRAYAEVGEPQAIREHHQGGTTGYQSREVVATPHTRDVVAPNMAFAWNPSLVGAKIEDTILLDAAGNLEVLTVDDDWPTVSAEHGERPAVLDLSERG